MSGLPMGRVKDVLFRLLPNEELESAKNVPSSRITRQYTLNLKSKRQLLLGLSPTNATRLLRHEQNVLAAEATLVSFLNENPAPQETDPEVIPSRRSPPASLSKLNSSPTIVPQPLPTPSPQPPAQTLSPPSLPPLQTFLPTIIHHDASTKELGYPYSIYEPVAGTLLSATKCTDEELYAVNFQLGQLSYNMATIVSPNGTFGPVLKVLGDSELSRPLSPISSPVLAKLPLTAGSSSNSSRRPSQTTPLSGIGAGGSTTWDIAFKTMAEAILRDGEDLSVYLPYNDIRRHISRLSHVLKTITVPRLLLFNAGDNDNILVCRTPPPASASGSLELVGFRDWTAGIFGDPLLGSFWEDWDGAGPRRKGWGDGCKFIDKTTLYTRLMLYRCHRACVDIVREYYRPRRDSSQREMVARKRLTDVLRELDEVMVNAEVVGSPDATPAREIINPYSPQQQAAATEPPQTPKRTKDQALPRDLSPRKKPKLEADPAEADDEKEDKDEDDEESSEEEEEERYQPPAAALRPNPASLNYILNS